MVGKKVMRKITAMIILSLLFFVCAFAANAVVYAEESETLDPVTVYDFAQITQKKEETYQGTGGVLKSEICPERTG